MARRGFVQIVTLVALLLMLAPSASHAFTKAIWGQVYRGGVNQFPLYRTLGVSVFELELPWNAVAPTRPRRAGDPHDPAYRWPTEVADAVAQARRLHMRVMLDIVGTPSWANGGHHDPGWAPRKPRDFAAFAAAASRRYPPVHLWMIWREPTKANSFQPLRQATPGTHLTRAERGAPHRYARLLDAAYAALKKVSKRNLVIGGCTYTTGAIDTRQWIQNLRLPNGKPPRMDLYAHNPFSFTEPNFGAAHSPFDEVQFSDLPTLARWIDRYLHRGLRLFLSEWTIPTAPDQEFNFYVDPQVAARWIGDAMRLSRGWKRIYALGWVHVYDDPPFSYGGLLTAAGVRKPSFYAFARG